MSLLVHFLIGALGAFAIFLVAARDTRTERFSFPSAVVLEGLFCASGRGSRDSQRYQYFMAPR
jgi:uncharacterized YccA/Bax inhibitor family protein